MRVWHGSFLGYIFFKSPIWVFAFLISTLPLQAIAKKSGTPQLCRLFFTPHDDLKIALNRELEVPLQTSFFSQETSKAVIDLIQFFNKTLGPLTQNTEFITSPSVGIKLMVLADRQISDIPLSQALELISTLKAVGIKLNAKTRHSFYRRFHRETAQNPSLLSRFSMPNLYGLIWNIVEAIRANPDHRREYLESKSDQVLEIGLIESFSSQPDEVRQAVASEFFHHFFEIDHFRNSKNQLPLRHLLKLAKIADESAKFVNNDVLLEYLQVLKTHQIKLSSPSREIFLHRLEKQMGWNTFKRIQFSMLTGVVSVFDRVPASFSEAFASGLKNLMQRQAGRRGLERGNLALPLWILTMIAPAKALSVVKSLDPRKANRYFGANQNDKRQILFIYQYFYYVFGQDISWLREHVNSDSYRSGQSSTHISILQKSIKKEIKQIFQGYEIIAEAEVFDNIFADYLVEGLNLIIEVDGPFHFAFDANGNRHPLLRDIRRDEILKAGGFEVFRIDGHLLSNANSKDKVMKSLFKKRI